MGMQIGPPQTPEIIKKLLIANAAVFLIQTILRSSQFAYFEVYFTVVPKLFWTQGYVWQAFTYMFLHGSFAHIAANMFSLWMFGSPLALAWGNQRFLKYYLTCGTGAGFIIASYPYLFRVLGFDAPTSIPTLGASGATMGVLLAYALTWPNRRLMLLFPPIPIKALYLIPLLFVLEFTMGPANVSHAGHLGGVLVGFLYLWRSKSHAVVPTWRQIKYRWERYRMRKRLREANRDFYRGDDPPNRPH